MCTVLDLADHASNMASRKRKSQKKLSLCVLANEPVLQVRSSKMVDLQANELVL